MGIVPSKGEFFGRLHEGSLVFLCDRCGKIHRHGPNWGNRSAHCLTNSERKFGRPYEEYDLSGVKHGPGYLRSEEATTMFELSRIALGIVQGMHDLLDIADVDPTAEAFAQIARARDSLEKLCDLSEENPFEMITDSGKALPEEDDEE